MNDDIIKRHCITINKLDSKIKPFDKKEYKKIIRRMKKAPIMIHNIPMRREIIRNGFISKIIKLFKK